ncbi:PLAC8 family protein [Metarhizium album ARSEF 1941]|uniref:PLAC8 family protein n=1 Tax=Metarhizium album (strain ARSEF 1941) TaxID=1081103 RepID=A0A0B2WTV2_METAS|nr:PLAC8 family protein [Metarhizium album ARSEF 1941]KHN97483.1 PLAC8 family protein [Metarhizium album ARSEF 1941]
MTSSQKQVPVTPQPTSTPAPVASQHGQNGLVDQADLDDWKSRFNDVLSRPGEVLKSKSPETAQPWSAGFFDCFHPIDTCFVTCCLPCVAFGKTRHRLRNSGSLDEYGAINTSCLLYCGAASFGLHWVPVAMQRMNMREKHNLTGSCLEDILTSCFCYCCSLVQQDKEAEQREQQLLSSSLQQQYKSNDEMQYVPKTAPKGFI